MSAPFRPLRPIRASSWRRERTSIPEAPWRFTTVDLTLTSLLPILGVGLGWMLNEFGTRRRTNLARLRHQARSVCAVDDLDGDRDVALDRSHLTRKTVPPGLRWTEPSRKTNPRSIAATPHQYQHGAASWARPPSSAECSRERACCGAASTCRSIAHRIITNQFVRTTSHKNSYVNFSELLRIMARVA